MAFHGPSTDVCLSHGRESVRWGKTKKAQSEAGPAPLLNLLLRGLDDQMNSEPILDAMLVQRVPILEDLACEDQDQLILLCLKSPGDLLFEL